MACASAQTVMHTHKYQGIRMPRLSFCTPHQPRLKTKRMHIENQPHTSCIPISPILPCNMTYIAVQSQLYCAVKWVRLKSKV